MTKRGGRIELIFLLSEDEVPLSTNAIVDNEYTIYGIFRYAITYKKAIEILLRNLEKVNELIIHRFKFDKTKESFEFVRTNKDKGIKVGITM